jgi:glycosyltransferase involved in cell wall biosynthesis
MKHDGELDNVLLRGHKAGIDLAEEYANCLAVVLPSIWPESFGLCIVEGYRFKKPAIGSNICGIKEVIIQDVTGLLFTPGSSNSLAEKIEILEENDVLCAKMGIEGYKLAESCFSEELHFRKLYQFYNNEIYKKHKSK